MLRNSPESSPSSQEASSSQFAAILALGEKLVGELKLLESTNTLARWMAHYVAERIEAAKTAPPETRADEEARCAKAIFELWDHRAGLPDGARPFEGLKPVIETLAALDPESPRRFYGRGRWPETEPPGEDPLVRRWLRLAESIDDTARIVIDTAIRRAAAAAADDAAEWVALARAAGANRSPDITIIEELLAGRKGLKTEREAQRDRLRGRLARLQDFLGNAVLLEKDLEDAIAALEDPESKSSE